MLASVTIRILTSDDSALLDSVHEDVFDEPVRPERLAVYLREPCHILMVAVHDGTVIAQVAAVIHRHPDKVTELYVDEVGVAEPWRGQGVATEMLKRMFAHGRSLGCEEAWVGTEVDNMPARRLYDRLVGGNGAEAFVMYTYDLREPPLAIGEATGGLP